MRINWDSIPAKEKEQLAFLLQVRSMTKDEFGKKGRLGFSPIKSEGDCIRAADFYCVDPNGYDLFDSDENRVEMLNKYGIN